MSRRRSESPVLYNQAEASRRKQKRYLSRSDEEIREEMDQINLSYRRGWPALPVLPLDTVTDGAKELVEDANERLKEVGTILTAQRITSSRFFFAFRIPRDANLADDNSAHLTLMFTADFLNDAHKIDNTIVQLRSKLRGYASTNGVKIEALDFRAVKKVPSYIIRHNEKYILSCWDKVAESVLAILKDQEWISLELLRRGVSSQTDWCPPTVVISSSSAGDPVWQENLLPAIRSKLAKYSSSSASFGVELLSSTSLLGSRRKYAPTDVVDGSAYQQSVRMGSSIGISNDQISSGTLGGILVLENNIRCGLTNWHVVSDSRIDQAAAKDKDGALRPGHPTLKASPQRIVTPSNSDHNGYLGALRASIEVHRQEVADGKEESKAFLKEAESEFARLEKMDRRIGDVVAGSDLRMVEVLKYMTDKSTGKSREKEVLTTSDVLYLTILDWALLNITNPKMRDQDNRLPKSRLPTVPGTQLVPNQACDKWTVFDVEKEDVQAAKYGRTTGWTFGEINAAFLYVNPKLDQQVSEVFKLTMERPARCLGVANRKAAEDFLNKGDSGSILVHDGSGAWLGLLWGLSEGGQGYLIPMDVVFQDIKRITNQTVTPPLYIDPVKVGLAKYQLG